MEWMVGCVLLWKLVNAKYGPVSTLEHEERTNTSQRLVQTYTENSSGLKDGIHSHTEESTYL